MSPRRGVIVDARADPPSAAAVEIARSALAAGRVVALPTDTVYGLAADPTRAGAVEAVFRLKGRPTGIALPVLVAGEDQADALTADVPAAARRLMAAFWPGALTVVLARRADVHLHLGGEDATIGLRCPAHPLIRAVCRAAGPVAVTSANLHGEPPLTTAVSVAEAFGPALELVLDGGPCAGPASTVVDCTALRVRLLRDGALSWERVLAVASGEHFGGAPPNR